MPFISGEWIEDKANDNTFFANTYYIKIWFCKNKKVLTAINMNGWRYQYT